MQFYQKTRENCVKTHVILKKASFYACLTLFAGMAFPMPFVGFAVNCHRTTAC